MKLKKLLKYLKPLAGSAVVSWETVEQEVTKWVTNPVDKNFVMKVVQELQAAKFPEPSAFVPAQTEPLNIVVLFQWLTEDDVVVEVELRESNMVHFSLDGLASIND